MVIYKWRESGGLQLFGIPDNDSLAKECADLAAFAEMTAWSKDKVSRFFSGHFIVSWSHQLFNNSKVGP
jgi:hypothetical protein